MIIESVFQWQNAFESIPKFSNKGMSDTSERLLFIVDSKVEIGVAHSDGYFTIDGLVYAMSPIQYPQEKSEWGHDWESDLAANKYPIVSHWAYLSNLIPKLDITRSNLIGLYQWNLEGKNHLDANLIYRADSLLEDIYKLDKVNFEIPNLVANSINELGIQWEANGRKVTIVMTEDGDQLEAKSPKFTHTFFPFDANKVYEWLVWLKK